MRFVAPPRGTIDPAAFDKPPLSEWHEFDGLLRSTDWPTVDALNALRRDPSAPRFVVQTRELESEGLHYELRIGERGEIATRENNWHDLLNALIWIRYPSLKTALNRRQREEIAIAGPKARTRAQCALTHFDEAGVVVVLRDEALLRAWDAHDWTTLFWTHRQAWLSGDAVAIVFGHALLEHALRAEQLLCGKALVIVVERDDVDLLRSIEIVSRHIAEKRLLCDPQELRPLPVSGIPGWFPGNESLSFYASAACFQPLRAGRRYPTAVLGSLDAGASDAVCCDEEASMRTTLDVDNEVLDAVKEIARRTGSTAGAVISELARRALTQTVVALGVREPRAKYGFRPIPARGKVTSNSTVDRLRDEEGV